MTQAKYANNNLETNQTGCQYVYDAINFKHDLHELLKGGCLSEFSRSPKWIMIPADAFLSANGAQSGSSFLTRIRFASVSGGPLNAPGLTDTILMQVGSFFVNGF
jgi:hypothetical protein